MFSLSLPWKGRQNGRAPWSRLRAEDVARRHGLSPGGKAVPAFVTEAVAPGKRDEVHDLLVGRDAAGSYHLGRREAARLRQNFLLADLPLDYQLGDFALRSWIEERSEGRRKEQCLRSELRWNNGDGALGSPAAHSVVNRICEAWSAHASGLGQLPMELQVQGRRLLLLSVDPVDPRRLDEFLGLALELRQAVLEARPTLASGYAGHSGALGPLPGMEADTPGTEDPTISAALSSLEETQAVLPLSAYDLVRDSRPITPLEKESQFGIPEPCDEVVLLSGYHTR